MDRRANPGHTCKDMKQRRRVAAGTAAALQYCPAAIDMDDVRWGHLLIDHAGGRDQKASIWQTHTDVAAAQRDQAVTLHFKRRVKHRFFFQFEHYCTILFRNWLGLV